MTIMSGDKVFILVAAVIISLILTVYPSFPPRHIPKQYHFVSQRKNWLEALSYCQANYVDLASIHNMDEQNRFYNLLQSKNVEMAEVRKAWTGLHIKWAWSYEKAGFYSPGEIEFRQWASSQPPDNIGNQDCVLLSLTQGGWVDHLCTAQKGFICYDANHYGDHYIIKASTLSWPDAQKYCQSQHTDLASVRNLDENNQLMALLNSSAHSEAWIGLYRARWGWTDRSEFSLNYFRDNGGTMNMENCAALNLDFSGKWDDNSCDTQYPFVCQTNGAHRLIVRFNVSLQDSSINLTDTLQAAIMEQIKQRLESNGIPANTNLTWRYVASHHITLPWGKP